MKKVVLFALLLSTTPCFADPPVFGSDDWNVLSEYSEWLQLLHNSEGSPCCNIADGRPLDSSDMRAKDGHLQIHYSRKHWQDTGPDEWLDVPEKNVLHRYKPTGVTIAWVHMRHVLCFAPGDAT